MDADIYVLANSRDTDVLIGVLDKYLPERVYQIGSEEEKYECWDDANNEKLSPSLLFDTENELLDFLGNQSNILFRPSFRSTIQSEFRVTTFYYFQDDSLVVGVNINQDLEEENNLLAELKSILNSIYGYIAYHVPPAHGKEEFINQCKQLK